MQIMLFAHGRMLYPSWLCQQYEPVACAPQRHNKVVVDKRPNANEGKSRQRYEFSPGGEIPHEHLQRVESRRHRGAMSLFLTDQYAADVYDVNSDQQHTYDWFLHGIGNLELAEAPLYRPSADFAVDYPWIEHERRWQTDSAVRADFVQRDGGVIRGIGRWTDVWFNGFAGVRMTLLGEPGTSVYGGDDPFSAPEIDWGRQHPRPSRASPPFVLAGSPTARPLSRSTSPMPKTPNCRSAASGGPITPRRAWWSPGRSSWIWFARRWGTSKRCTPCRTSATGRRTSLSAIMPGSGRCWQGPGRTAASNR